MKAIRRILFGGMMVLLVCSLALPAFAADVRANVFWVAEIEKFQEISESSRDSYPGYTTVLQRFLWEWDDQYADWLAEAGGIDGFFGSKTGDCVEDYQKNKKLHYIDRAVGKETWGAIGGNLADDIQGNGYTHFNVGNTTIFRAPSDYTPVFAYFLNYSWIQFHPNPNN